MISLNCKALEFQVSRAGPSAFKAATFIRHEAQATAAGKSSF
jgi:hypothetical protein